jgi:hypothetical protein
MNGTIYGENVFGVKYVVWFPVGLPVLEIIFDPGEL